MTQIARPQREYPFSLPVPENMKRGGALLDYYDGIGFVLRIYNSNPDHGLLRMIEKQEAKLYNYSEPNNPMICSVFSFGMAPVTYYLTRFDPSLIPGASESVFPINEVHFVVINSRSNLVLGLRKLKMPDNYMDSIRKMHASSKGNENFAFSYLTWANMIESRNRLDDIALKSKLMITWR